jgi:hypothetical protein
MPLDLLLKTQRHDGEDGRLDLTLTLMTDRDAHAAGRVLQNPSPDEVLTTFGELIEELRDSLPAAEPTEETDEDDE